MQAFHEMKYIILFLWAAIAAVLFWTNGQAGGRAGRDEFEDEMVYIPAGRFIMGSNETDGRIGFSVGVDELPRHEVYLDGFYIDRYEATNREYLLFIQATGNKLPYNKTHPDDPYIWKDGIYPEGNDNRPVSLIDWFDADAYCKWNGKRLPTEAEWEKAARGTDGRVYPWGDRFDRFRTNTLDLGVRMLVVVNRFPNGVSPYGVYNMSGNVWEWTSSWYMPYPGSALKRKTFGKKYRVARGGSFLNPADINGRTAGRLAVRPDHPHRTLGVRCARSDQGSGIRGQG